MAGFTLAGVMIVSRGFAPMAKGSLRLQYAGLGAGDEGGGKEECKAREHNGRGRLTGKGGLVLVRMSPRHGRIGNSCGLNVPTPESAS